VVTAGPTREPLDPVRYLTNYSSGKQGFAIAQAAVEAGASVTLITGPVNLPSPVGVERIDVTDTHSMLNAVLAYATSDNPADALIMAAAVADFRPTDYAEHKIKKVAGDQGRPLDRIDLTENPDILCQVAQQLSKPACVIGFAAESDDLIAHAQEKLERKNLDLIVANDITAIDAGFAVDTNRAVFITPEGLEELPLMSKEAVARHIISWLVTFLTARTNPS
jgi:phosphopantothenoylcysteine decarboxylase/phosphopantothenate--cysteine ligase